MTAIKVEASIVHMHDVAVELEPICQHFATRWTPPPSLHRSLKRYVNIASAKQPISLGALRLDRNKKNEAADSAPETNNREIGVLA